MTADTRADYLASIEAPIFKRDSAGKIRVWLMEREGSKYRTHSGIEGGAIVISDWTECVGKQGRSDEEQAKFEISSGYVHKLTREYHETRETIDAPHFFKPMLAHKFEGWKGPGFAQPKLDGIRCIVTEAGMFSREGKPILGAPHIREELEPFFAHRPDAILDGELYNHDLKDDFNTIVSAVKKQNPTPAQLATSKDLVQYHVYDFPSAPGMFGNRSNDLHLGLEDYSDLIQLVDTRSVATAESFDDLHGQWLEQGYEGSMLRANGPYEQKRSKCLLKRKEFQDAEYEVVAIQAGVGNWAGKAKKVICRLPDGREFGAGIKGSMTRAAELLGETHNTATIKFFMLTPDGIPRFGVATAFHGTEGRL